jgi:cytochrome c
MKRTLLILGCISLMMASCGGGDNKTDTKAGDTTTKIETPATEAPAEAHPGEALIKASDCLGCHNKTQKVIGPAYVNVAKLYELNDENVATLAKHIIEGSKGVWGDLPMTPHPNVSEADAKEMVHYILSLR